MKNSLFIFLLVIYINANAQNKKANIYYKIINVESFSSIYISDNGKKIYENQSKKTEGIITVELNEPEKVILTLNGDVRNTKFFWLDNGNYEMIIDASNNKLSFKNSKLNDEYYVSKKLLDSIRVLEQPYFQKIKDINITQNEQKRILTQIDSIEHIAATIQYDYLYKNTNSYLALDFLRFHVGNNDFDKEKLRTLFNSLPIDFYDYPTYKLCREALLINSLYKVGDTIKNIKIQLNNGTEQNLSYYFKDKYTYLDFWSSGCQGSRMNHKAIKKCNRQFNDKVNFISISDDIDRKNWLTSIKEDKINWTNSCDFKGMLSPIKMHFNIHSLPTGILIDKNGIIIKNDFKSIDINLLEQYVK